MHPLFVHGGLPTAEHLDIQGISFRLSIVPMDFQESACRLIEQGLTSIEPGCTFQHVVSKWPKAKDTP